MTDHVRQLDGVSSRRECWREAGKPPCSPPGVDDRSRGRSDFMAVPVQQSPHDGKAAEALLLQTEGRTVHFDRGSDTHAAGRPGHRPSMRMTIGARYAAATSTMTSIVRHPAQDRPTGRSPFGVTTCPPWSGQRKPEAPVPSRSHSSVACSPAGTTRRKRSVRRETFAASAGPRRSSSSSLPDDTTASFARGVASGRTVHRSGASTWAAGWFGRRPRRSTAVRA